MFNFLKTNAVDMLSSEHKKRILQELEWVDQYGVITEGFINFTADLSDIIRSGLRIGSVQKGDLYWRVLSSETINDLVYSHFLGMFPSGIVRKDELREALLRIRFPERKIEVFTEKFLAEHGYTAI